jgi:DNA polymerase-4
VHAENEKDEIKSVGNSITFYRDLKSEQDVQALLILLAESVCSRMEDYGYHLARTVHLTITTNDLNSVTRQTKIAPTALASDVAAAAYGLFKQNFGWNMGLVRALGVAVSDFTDEEQTSFLDTSNVSKQKQKTLQDTVETLRRRFGRNVINKAIVYTDDKMQNLNIKDINDLKIKNNST